MKEKLIIFETFRFQPEGWGLPISQVILKILPALKKEHDKWVKGGWHKETNEWEVSEFQDFIEFLADKYCEKKT